MDDSNEDPIYVSQRDATKSFRHSSRGVGLPIVEGEILAERYTVCSPLGSGGFGMVYLVNDSVLKEPRALKVVVADESQAGQAEEQILHEFKLRERISDTSHIVRSEDPRPCQHKGLSLILLPMEFADGGNLRQWLETNPEVEKRCQESLELFKQVGLGLKAIHEAGLVHLDIKPENILLVEGTAKVTDLGIGRYVNQRFKDNPDHILRQRVGTPHYMSPEQFQTTRQKDIGPASDIYSLGVVLYELLDGGLPFDGDPNELREKHLHLQPSPLRGKAARWWPVVEGCLAKAPDKRYASVARLLADLDRASQGAALSVDVACPKCGHINEDVLREYCDNCHVDISSLLRECPRCFRRIRRDAEICQKCGFAIGAHYLCQLRKQQVAKLKDEDPVEAIELLELMLREGAGNEEVALIKELRAQQSTISPWITQADTATSDGEPEKALEFWSKILEVIPRHRLALAQIQKLKSLLEEFNGYRDEAVDLMDKAQFDEAEKRLQACLELIPTRQAIRQVLNDSRTRARKYATSFEQAKQAKMHRLFPQAVEHLDAALSQAPRSPQALSLKEEIVRIIERTHTLIQEAQSDIEAARFEKAEEGLRQVEAIWVEYEELDDIKQILLDTKAEFNSYMNQAREADTNKGLNQAREAVQCALTRCPDSVEASQLLEAIKQKQAVAHAFLKKAEDCLEAAEFAQAREQLAQAREYWPLFERIKTSEDQTASTEHQYTAALHDVETSRSQRNHDIALAHCNQALRLCPNSRAARQLRQSITDAIARREELHAKVIKVATFLIKLPFALVLTPIVVIVVIPLAWLGDKRLSKRKYHSTTRFFNWPEHVWRWLIRDVWRGWVGSP